MGPDAESQLMEKSSGQREIRCRSHDSYALVLATPCVLLCDFVEVCVGDADLFNDFAFIVKNSNLRLRFVDIDAHVVISGRGRGVLWSPECVKRNDIAVVLRPRPTELGRAAITILLFLRIQGPLPSRTRRCIS